MHEGLSSIDLLRQLPLSRPDNQLEKHYAERGNRTQGTCEWILSDQTYQTWEYGGGGFRSLCLTGSPGTGKTVISTFLVETFRAQNRVHEDSDPCYLAFFLCAARDKSRCTALAVLRGLLTCLCEKNEDLLQYLLTSVNSRETSATKVLNDFDVLWQMFTDMISHSDSKKFLFLVDAIDECDDKEREKLLSHFRRLELYYDRTQFNLRLLVTCRRDDHARILQISSSQILSLNNSHTIEDLRRVISDSVDHLAINKAYDPKLRGEIENELLQKHGGNFLWIALAIQELSRVDENSKALALARRIPSSLYDFYDTILERASRHTEYETQFLMHMMRIASSPFTVDEFAISLFLFRRYSTDAHHLAQEPPMISETLFYETKGRIKKICSDLVVIDEQNQTLRFMHESVKDYLTETPWSQSQYRLAYLYAAVMLILSIMAWRSIKHASIFFVNVLMLYVYNCTVGRGQYRLSILDNVFQIRWIFEILPGINAVRMLYNVLIPRAHWWQFLVLFQCLDVRPEPYLEKPLLAMQSYARTQMHKHALKCSSIVFYCFPWKSSFCPSKIRSLETWLKLAAEEGDVFFIKLLLNAKADIETQVLTTDQYSHFTPLAVAAACGNAKAVEQLLDVGADVCSRDSDSRTPLMHAVIRKHPDCVKLLAQSQSNIDATDLAGESAMTLAIVNDDRLRDSIDENITASGDAIVILGGRESSPRFPFDGSDWLTSLVRFTDTKSQLIVQMLLERTQLVDLVNLESDTLLMKAARNHYWEIVTTLLDAGADPNRPDSRGLNPLLSALRSPRRIQIIRNLTACDRSMVFVGAANFIVSVSKPEHEPVETRSLLSSMIQALEKLISKTTDLEARDFTGRTALSLAAENGQVGVVRLLLKHGASVDSTDDHGMTPLMWASRLPIFRKTMVENCTLVDQSLAVYGTHSLLMKGSVLTMSDEQPDYAELRVSQRLTIIEALHDADCDVNARDYTGRSAVHHADHTKIRAHLVRLGATATDTSEVRSRLTGIDLIPVDDELLAAKARSTTDDRHSRDDGARGRPARKTASARVLWQAEMSPHRRLRTFERTIPQQPSVFAMSQTLRSLQPTILSVGDNRVQEWRSATAGLTGIGYDNITITDRAQLFGPIHTVLEASFGQSQPGMVISNVHVFTGTRRDLGAGSVTVTDGATCSLGDTGRSARVPTTKQLMLLIEVCLESLLYSTQHRDFKDSRYAKG